MPSGAHGYSMTIGHEKASEIFRWKTSMDSGEESGSREEMQAYILPEGFPYSKDPVFTPDIDSQVIDKYPLLNNLD